MVEATHHSAYRDLRKLGIFATFFAVAFFVMKPIHGAPFVWDGGGADDSWGTALNWDTDTVLNNDTNDALTFSGTTRTSPELDMARTINSITFSDTPATAGSFTISGNDDITFSAATGITNNSAVLQTVSANLVAPAAGLNLTSTSGDLAIGQDVDLAAGGTAPLTVDGANDTTIIGVISGTGATLAKQGAGTLTLNGVNTYTGNTTLTGGTLVAAANGALGTGTLTINTGTTIRGVGPDRQISNAVVVSGDFTISSDEVMDFTGTVDLGGATRTITLATDADSAWAGVVSNGDMIKDGAGTLVLKAANTYAGGTVLNAGTLGVEDNASLGTGGLTINAGTLRSDDNQPTLANTIAVNGDFTISGNPTPDSGATSVDLTLTGSVNLTGAVRTITVNAGTLTDVEFSGVISNGSLTKAGLGTMVLSGTNTYTGDTTVDAGTLIFNGEIAGDMVVNTAGTLKGTGTVNGDATISGVLNPGSSANPMDIVGGNLNLNSNTTLVIETESSVLAGQVAVTGTANLNDSKIEIVPVGHVPANGDTYTIVTATVGVTGAFSLVNLDSATLKYNLTHNANDVMADVTVLTFASFGTNPNQNAVGNVIDTIRPTATGDWITVVNALNSLNETQLATALGQLVPEEIGSLSTISFGSAAVQSGSVSTRLAQVRADMDGSRLPNLQLASATTDPQGDLQLMVLAQPWGSYGDSYGSESKSDKPLKETWRFFVSGNGTFGDVDSTDGQAGYDFNVGGVTFGMDRKVYDRLIVGMMGGFSESSADVDDNGGGVDAQSFRFGVYGSYYDDQGFYADGMVSGAYHDYDSERNVLMGTLFRKASASPDGLEISVMGAAGYDFEVGNFRVGPTVSLQYTYLSIDDYKESGAGALNLDIDSQTADSLLVSLGVRAATLIELPKLRIIPELRLSFQYEAEDQERRITAQFLSGGGGKFGFNTTDIGQESALIGAGVTFLNHKNMSSFIDYTAEVGRTDYVAHYVRGGMRISF